MESANYHILPNKMILNKKNKILLIILTILFVGLMAWLLSGKIFGTSTKKIIIKESSSEQESLIPQEKIQEDTLVKPDLKEKPSGDEKVQLEKEASEDKKTAEDNSSASSIGIIKKLVSLGFEKTSGRNIDTIIIHSSYDAIGSEPFDLDGLIREYKSYEVSPHFLIDRSGKIYQLVEEKNIAYHAGESQAPDGRSDVNRFSIGIELMNTKEGNFTEKQYDSLRNLLIYIKGRYKIKYVLGHSQIAQGRKDDPWNFDWEKIK